MEQNALDKKYRAFVRWYVSDKSDDDSTIEYCKSHGLTSGDIKEWCTSGTFEDDVFEESIRWLKQQTPTIIKDLMKKYEATKDLQILKQLKEFIVINKQTKDEAKGTTNNYQFNILSTSDEQYRQIIERESRILAGGIAGASPELLSDGR